MNRDSFIDLIARAIGLDQSTLEQRMVGVELLAEYDHLTAVIDEQAIKLDQRGAQIIAMDINIRELEAAIHAAGEKEHA